jgi:hypothetical protein
MSVISDHGLHHTQASPFADDTAIYCAASTPSDLQTKLNEDLIHLKSWVDENRLSLNLLKTKLMLICSRQRLKSFGSLELSIDDHILEREDRHKYLGVIINETLSWADHIDYVRTNYINWLRHLGFQTHQTSTSIPCKAFGGKQLNFASSRLW